MKVITLISHTNQLLRIIFKSSKPADRIASEYFRSKKYIGSKERKFISEICFYSLRNYYLLEYLLSKIKPLLFNDINDDNNEKNELFLIIIGLIIWDKLENSNVNYLINLINLQHDENFNDVESFLFQLIESNYNSPSKANDLVDLVLKELKDLNDFIQNSQDYQSIIPELSWRFSINTFLIESLIGNFKGNLLKLFGSLTKSAKLNLRVNTENSRKEIVNLLNVQNIFSKETILSPVGINIEDRVNLSNLEIFKSGLIEVQDEGSQLITYALSPTSGTRILDACAGAGGKSLHIASITSNTTDIIASDIDNRKLNELLKRSAKFGFNNIKTICLNPGAIAKNDKKYFKKQFDYILVDAPCSGSGTVRRMPLPKYRLNEHLVERLKENQLRILNYYSQFLKEGGILVYSTCSILPQENQEVVEEFLKQNINFQPDTLKKVFLENNIVIPYLNDDDFMLNLYPSIYNTDGFFMARFRKGDF